MVQAHAGLALPCRECLRQQWACCSRFAPLGRIFFLREQGIGTMGTMGRSDNALESSSGRVHSRDARISDQLLGLLGLLGLLISTQAGIWKHLGRQRGFHAPLQRRSVPGEDHLDTICVCVFSCPSGMPPPRITDMQHKPPPQHWITA